MHDVLVFLVVPIFAATPEVLPLSFTFSGDGGGASGEISWGE